MSSKKSSNGDKREEKNEATKEVTREGKHYIRSPIVTVMGHVDHGKTTILDRIRGSRVAEKEAGRITQMVGASLTTKQSIEAISKEIKKQLAIELHIPGLLFIDTPGHEVFTSLRARGGSIADIAILVIDIKQGIQPQTVESIDLLKEYKTPFVVAANKIDLIDGWRTTKHNSVLKALEEQPSHVKERFDELIYDLMGQLSMHGFNAELFYRIKDFTKELSIIPVSGKTGEGLAELLLLVAGLSERYLKDRLYIHPKAEPKGTVIEVKEEKGLGITVDAILYDGVLREGSEIYFMAKDGLVKRKIRALLMPNVSGNNPREKYTRIKEVVAAGGVKIAAPELDNVLPGSPFGAGQELEKALETDMKHIIFEHEGKEGVVAKTDSLGSAEALLNLLRKENIKVAKLDVGPVNKDDIVFAAANKKDEYRAVLVFNMHVQKEIISEAEGLGVKLIVSDVIYKLPELYEEFKKEVLEKAKNKMAEQLPFPAKLKALRGFFFRKSKPAVFGVRVLGGVLKPSIYLMNENGETVGQIKSIQSESQSMKEAKEGEEVAISVEGAELGKDIHEDEVFYTSMGKKDVERWEEKQAVLEKGSAAVLEEIKAILLKRQLRRIKERARKT